jgi:hypothetical protein
MPVMGEGPWSRLIAYAGAGRADGTKETAAGGSRLYARLVRFTFRPGKRVEAQALADDLAPQIEALDGCSGVTVFGDEADGEYGIFVLWDSQAAADAAAGVISPQLSKHLAGSSLGAPDIRLFEVLSR